MLVEMAREINRSGLLSAEVGILVHPPCPAHSSLVGLQLTTTVKNS